MNIDISVLLELAIEVARKGGNQTIQYFNKDIKVDRKDDDSPVTAADREAEAVMRTLIEGHYPEHGILGEEHGHTNKDSNVQWILDPIDGTQSFIHDVPLYTTLVGIVIDGNPEIGIIYAPVLDQLVDAAIGKGARLNGVGCRVSDQDDLSKASFMTTDVTHIGKYGFSAAFDELLENVQLHRTWGDAYGHLMVATGRAEIMLDPILNIWDAAPLLPIMKEAGGSFTDVDGNETIDGGNGFSCNKVLYPEVADIFARNKK